jgi:hypothetical protein
MHCGLPVHRVRHHPDSDPNADANIIIEAKSEAVIETNTNTDTASTLWSYSTPLHSTPTHPIIFCFPVFHAKPKQLNLLHFCVSSLLFRMEIGEKRHEAALELLSAVEKVLQEVRLRLNPADCNRYSFLFCFALDLE